MVTNILEYLEHSAAAWPEKIAIADDKNALTFAQWKDYAERIGTALSVATNGALRKPELVFVDRKMECLAGFMGVVESGNFYVPIDCKMPYERVKLISDVLNPIAAITVTVADEKILDQIAFDGFRFNYAEATQNDKDEERLTVIREQSIDLDPVYSIFTSKSNNIITK